MPDEIYQITNASTLPELIDQLNVALFEISKRLNPTISFTLRRAIDSHDFTVSDFATDGEWHDLDLSSIIPADAKLVILSLAIEDGAAGNTLEIRSLNQSDAINIIKLETIAVDYDTNSEGILDVSASKKLVYRTSNTTFTAINLTVRGYWIW